jgi:hypothetical protein
MIIFGWGRQTEKQIGIAFKNLCSHCHNEDYWVLSKITTWFTLFFIPVIPYSDKYFLACPVCKYGLTLDYKQVEEIKPLAETNQLLIDGKITVDEHQGLLAKLHEGSADPLEAEVLEVKSMASKEKNLTYCGNCGTVITKDIKFCGNCGTGITS